MSRPPDAQETQPVVAGHVLWEGPITRLICKDLDRLLFRCSPFVMFSGWCSALVLAFVLASASNPAGLVCALAVVALCYRTIPVGGRLLIGGQLSITLECHEVRLTAVKGDLLDTISVPREQIPFLDDGGPQGADLRWAASTPVRVPLGRIPRIQREAFEAWQNGDVVAVRSSRIEISAVPSRRICPLCHDQVGGPEPEGHCSDCETQYHSECWSELGGCALPSCRSLRVPNAAHPAITSHLVREGSRCA
ncbi:MAG: hypothetical protein JKY65_31960 [Planctomycetes bacterium]|nr:hypothetical protein [Planctomycetota bacterium]